MVFHLDSFFNVGKLDSFFQKNNVLDLLKELRAFLKTLPLGTIEGKVSNLAYLENPNQIYLGKGAIIEAGAYVRGPCYIGPNSQVRHGAYIRGDVYIGQGCVVGHTTEVKHSLFLEGAKAGHFAYVGDSILGREVNLGAGVKCANLKLNEEEVIIHHEGEKLSTGLKKLGAIIGDHTQIGCNAVCSPGTLIHKESLVYPLTHVQGVIAMKAVVKSNGKPSVKNRRVK